MPPAIMCDNPTKMMQSELNRKFKQSSGHLRQTEPFTPWSNVAEREIKRSGGKTIKSKTTKRIA